MSSLRDTNVSTADEATQADALREAMIAELREMTAIRSDQVADAFRTVLRHLFAPGEPLETVYAANSTVVTKRDEHGAALSALSAAHIQATMLEQAQLAAGMRVLEIGSGGYNAALIAELVGETGQVTTVDIDPDVVDHAQNCLAAAGYHKVNVVLADAEGGVPEHAPYDLVIVTVGAWDIPPAWSDQLADDGRIVVPLRMRGLTRSVVFERDGDHLVSRGYHLCGFVPMQGVGAHTERLVALDGDEVGLRVDDMQPVEADHLRHALFAPRVERWSGVVFDQVAELDLWLGTAVPVFGILAAKDGPIDRGLVARSANPRSANRGVPTALSAGSFAYRTKRSIEGTTDFETGVYAHGPEAEDLAEQYVKLLRTWDREHRRGPGARIEVYPAATPDADLPPGRVIDKKHTRVVISWP
ncbi:MAG: methyltransferase, FxLD system [Pseudonocardiaceae bacterium]